MLVLEVNEMLDVYVRVSFKYVIIFVIDGKIIFRLDKGSVMCREMVEMFRVEIDVVY